MASDDPDPAANPPPDARPSVDAAPVSSSDSGGEGEQARDPKPPGSPLGSLDEHQAAGGSSPSVDDQRPTSVGPSPAGGKDGPEPAKAGAEAAGDDDGRPGPPGSPMRAVAGAEAKGAADEAAAKDETPRSDSPAMPTPELTIAEVSLEYWTSLSEEHRIDYYNSIDGYFHNLLEDFRANANEALRGYSNFGRWSQRWRVSLIASTGGLALLNVLATSWPPKWIVWGTSSDDIKLGLSFAAAVYAVILALLSNVESFLNYFDKKSSTRESRELYLDAFREFEMLRLAHVYPYGYDPQACLNFSRLYRRLVIKDLELRRKIMQLSETRPGATAKG